MQASQVEHHLFIAEIGIKCLAVAQLCPTCATTWTVARQASLSMGFSGQEYCSELPFPSPEDLPDSPVSPALQVDSLSLSHWGSPVVIIPNPVTFIVMALLPMGTHSQLISEARAYLSMTL